MSGVIERLEALGIPSQTHDHPAVLTVEQMRGHWAAIDASHTKNLLLKDAGGKFWLVVMPAEASLDLKALPDRIGSKRLRFASPEDLFRLLSVTSGAVSAFALMNDTNREVHLVLDRRLATSVRIALHPLNNRQTTVVSTGDLLRFLSSLGVTPTISDLS